MSPLEVTTALGTANTNQHITDCNSDWTDMDKYHNPFVTDQDIDWLVANLNDWD